MGSIFKHKLNAMQRYVEQLITDLEEAASNPPALPYFETPPEIEIDDEISELAQVPFKSIEEWTGVQQIAFPHSFYLDDTQIEIITKAIFKVFDCLRLELIDVPQDIPAEWLYDVLVEYWVDKVQYLPSSGMDWEICTGDPQTCPYGEYCDCGEELPDDGPPQPFDENEDIDKPF